MFRAVATLAMLAMLGGFAWVAWRGSLALEARRIAHGRHAEDVFAALLGAFVLGVVYAVVLTVVLVD